MPPIRLLIIDSSEVGRHGLKALVERCTPRIDVVELLPAIEPLETWLQTHAVDVVLMSDEMPRVLDMPHVIKRLRVVAPKVRLIVLSQRLNLDYIQRLIQAGVRGFVLREEHLLDKLQTALATVMNDELYLSPRASALPFTASPGFGPQRLNNRDLEVLRLMALDYPVTEIAAALTISPRLVYRARERLRHALGVRTSEQIVGAAMAAGLLGDP